MLEIVSPEGISLDLPEDIAIDMEFNNPLFAEDSIVGDYSLTFNLPWTDTNVKAFRHVHIINTKELLNQEYTGYQIKFGNSFFKGTLVVTEVPWKKFEVRFKSNHGNFKKVSEGFTLNFNEMPETALAFDEPGADFWDLKTATEINSILRSLFNNTINIDGLTVNPYLFIPIYNEHAFDDNGQNLFYKHFNYYYNPNNFSNWEFHYLYAAPILSGIDDELPITPFSWQNFSPCINFAYLMYKLTTNLGYNFKGEVFKKRDLKDLFCVGNNANFHYWTYDSDPDGQTKEFRPIDGKLTMPKTPSKDLFLDFIKLFCVYFGISENKRTIELIAKEDILNNRSYIDVTDITAEEMNYLQEKRGFKFSYDFDSNDVVLNDETIEPAKEDKYIGDFATVISLPSATSVPINSLALVNDDDFFYRTERIGNAINWVKKYQNFSELQYGDGSNAIQVNSLNPCLVFRDPDQYIIDRNLVGFERNWKIPKFGNRMKMESAFSPYFESEDVRSDLPKLKLFFYRGLQRDSRPNSFYPLGTPDEYNYNNDVVGESSLKFHGERGIVNVWHKTYIEWRNRAKPVEMMQRYAIDILFNPELLWKNMIRVKEVNYRVKNIKVTLYKYKIGISKTTAYTA